MNTSNRTKLILVFVAAVGAVLVWLVASGNANFLERRIPASEGGSNSGGGGGHPVCQDYINTIQNLNFKLYQTKNIYAYQDFIDQYLNGDEDRASRGRISLIQMLADGMKLKCLPGDPKPYEAWTENRPDLGAVTTLNVESFKKLGSQEKTNFVIHELCILQGYEKNLDYSVSSQIIRIIEAVDASKRSQ